MHRCFVPVVVTMMFSMLFAETFLERSRRSTITLVRNGYEGVLIAIGESVPESESAVMLSHIEEFFAEASQTLFRATNKRVYFRNITVLVPNNWNQTTYEAATDETFAKANVVIDGSGLDTPTTWTYGDCGEPGEFIQIPIGFMTANRSAVVSSVGNPGRTLVHEWAHLRWGLRDEYPVAGEERYYRDSTGQIAAVKCGKYMTGTMVDEITGGRCTLSQTTGMPTSSCRFVADELTGITASLMFYHNLTEVTEFCDSNEAMLHTLHNDEAPSQQNIICGGRSAWEVMRGHSDFLGDNSAAMTGTESPPPHFRYVQAQNMRIVMVIDVSGSMVYNQTEGRTRLNKLRHASAEFLLTVVQQGMSVGIVKFSTRASILVNLTKITSESVKQSLVDKLPTYAGGITAIGQGLLKGVKLLEGAGDPRGGILILVSDGKENRAPRMAEVKPQLVAKGVILHVILISDAADKNMIELSATTGGKAFFDSGSPDTTDLQRALRKIGFDGGDRSPGVDPVQILHEAIMMEPKEEISRSVYIDSSVGRDTKFGFSYTLNWTLDVSLTSPSGVEYNVSGPLGDNSVVTKTVTLSIQHETEIGMWTINLKNRGEAATVTNLLVTSKSPSDDVDPIRTRTFLNQHGIDFEDTSTLKLVVRAQVRRGYSVVVGANVEVQVGSLPWKNMRDDGLGADIVKDDGYYSAIIYNFTSDGYFPVKVRTKTAGGNETRLITRGGSRAFKLYSSNEKITETLDPFVRHEEAGLISVNNIKSPSEMRTLYPFPPAKVNDLKVAEMSYENETVTLQWTAVGDYTEQETASSYDIRVSNDIRQLRHSFENATQIQAGDVLVGNVNAPLAAYEREWYVIRVPPSFNSTTMFISLKVNHSTTRISSLSNVVSVALVSVPPQSPATTADLPDITTVNQATDDSTTMDVISVVEDASATVTTLVEITSRRDSPTTPVEYTTQSEKPTTPVEFITKSDHPTTPIKSTTKSDHPTTPVESTTKSDHPTTPIESTTKSDHPTTPIESTTKSDHPTTPVESITKSDHPTTLIESTTKSDHPTTPMESTTQSDNHITPVEHTTRPDEPSSTAKDTDATHSVDVTAATRAESSSDFTTAKSHSAGHNGGTFQRNSRESSTRTQSTGRHELSTSTSAVDTTLSQDDNEDSVRGDITTIPIRSHTVGVREITSDATIAQHIVETASDGSLTDASTIATTTRKHNTAMPPVDKDTIPSNRTSVNGVSGSSKAKASTDDKMNSSNSQFVLKFALGTCLLVIVLIACPLMIKYIRSRKAIRNSGLWENWGQEHNLHRGPVESWDGPSPYTSPAHSVCNVGSRSVTDVATCYLPRVSTYPPRRYRSGSFEA